MEKMRYRVQDLGTLPGDRASGSFAINAKGQVVGYSLGYKPEHSADRSRAFLWDQGEMIDLGRLPGFRDVQAADINDRGEIVGSALTDKGFDQAFLWRGGKMTALGSLEGRGSSATAINNRSEIVGDSGPSAFLWTRGEMHALDRARSTAATIDDHGRIAGTRNGKGVLWASGAAKALPLIPSDINNKQVMVGSKPLGPNRFLQPVLFAGGRLRPLPLPPTEYEAGFLQEYALNNNGQVVGAVIVMKGDEAYHGFLWQKGKPYNLNDLIPANSGWVIVIPYDINDRGQIVGLGSFRGRSRGFLLTPD